MAVPLHSRQPHTQTHPGRWRRPVPRAAGFAVLGLLLAAVLWLSQSIRIGEILSDSMSPTLRRGDKYIIRIDAYRKEAPQRGDIVVIRRPENGELLVKRVIGVGGDEVGVMFGRAWVNGTWLDEPYIDKRPGIREFPILGRVPDGDLFLLGDNRNFSEDSRDIGTLPAANVMGRVTAIILPRARRETLERVTLDVPDPTR